MARHLQRSVRLFFALALPAEGSYVIWKFNSVLSYSRCGTANAVTSFLPLPSVLEVVRFKWHKSVTITNAGLQTRWQKFADRAHRPVLQISKKQNRELQYANVRWGKPVRRLQSFSPDKVQKSLIRQNLYLVEVISYQGSPRLNYP